MIRRFEAMTLTDALSRAHAAVGPRALVVDVQRTRAAVGDRVVVAVSDQEACPLERRLRARGVRAPRRRALLAGAAGRPGGAELVRQRLARAMPVAPAGAPAPRALALVGPTGVGKTTTIAKLAGRATLDEGRRVGLVTLDLYRVAAVDQLRAYADLLTAPLEVASSPDDLRGALERLRGCDLVLVDTAGSSPLDAARMGELCRLLRAAPEVACWLVLPATTRLRELRDALRRFEPFEPEGLVLTKLDEAVVAGEVLELLVRLPYEVRLLSTGQEVPADLEAPTPERLAGWVLGEEVPA